MNDACPLVSIIIPCHNGGSYLQKTVESALRQTYPRVETIVVDDGSTDASPAIIASFGDRILSTLGPNMGAASARNTGTALAKGGFLLYLDADDLLAPEAVVTRVEALTSTGADVAYADWQKLDETLPGVFQPGEKMQRRIEDVHQVPELALFTEFWCPPAALLYRRSLVDRIGEWRQDLAPIEDARFLLDAALAGGAFVHVPGVTAHYRIFHGPSHSRRSPITFASAVLRNALELETRWREVDRLDLAHQTALLSVYGFSARGLFRHSPEQFNVALAHCKRLGPNQRLMASGRGIP
ncbi:MAG: glycosyltransferase [Holophagaceae bacterium]|nr:glycosyltransferase [Holophagaceae bacterium]